MMLIGAIMEAVTLGAVIPFLSLMADPKLAHEYPGLQQVFSLMGWQRPDDLLLPTALAFGAIAALAGVVRTALSWTANSFTFQLGHDLSSDVYQRMLYQPYSYHTDHNTSQMVAAISKVEMITGGVILPLVRAVIAITMAVFIVTALLLFSPVATLGAFASFGLVYLGIVLATRQRLRENSEIVARAHSQRVQAVQEGLGGIRDVIIDASQDVFLRKFNRLDSEIRAAVARSTFIAESPRFVVESAGMILIAALALPLSRGEGGIAAALPVLGALALGAQRLLPLLQQLYLGRSLIASNWDVMEQVLDLLNLKIPPEHLVGSGRPTLPFSDAVRFRDVSFGYNADLDPALENVTLDIPRGSRVGFVGKTGSGKSTLMDLTMGLLEPTSGEISVDGQVLDAETRLTWRQQIAHVPQTIFLSDASLAENIAFGVEADEVDLERVKRAARQAQLASFAESLPQGYRTQIGERGVRLSGGQRQRIGIARALYKNSTLLVFDEATSALDGETEDSVMQAIAGLDRNLTLIIVAHRLSTVAFCDQIVRLEGGRIVQVGGFDAVIGSAAQYR